ncbi:hypothetical protein AAFF_G00055180 [Aldrovandia affinis]|uniref:Uncharacterized protein n=1 Tax=Aldrovandia affinis TaxID=143900 RepID=A0AAD7S115_9TELE|nr:hypothetical protein AAFF_G00055180 [Aldrovandia affinis]
MATLPVEELDDIRPITSTQQFRSLTPVQPHTSQQPAPRRPAPSPEPCSVSCCTVHGMCSDDKGMSTAESAGSISSSQPAKKRKRVSRGRAS